MREGAGRPIVGANSGTTYSGQFNFFCFSTKTLGIGRGRQAAEKNIRSIPRILPGGLTSVLLL